MGGIKYYQLAKDEELPDEFCAVRDIDGEPSEYTFYVPEAENAKLRELVRDMWFWGYEGHMDGKSQEWQMKHIDGVLARMRELGVEVDG